MGKVGTVVFRNRKQDQGRRGTRNTGDPRKEGMEAINMHLPSRAVCTTYLGMYYVVMESLS